MALIVATIGLTLPPSHAASTPVHPVAAGAIARPNPTSVVSPNGKAASTITGSHIDRYRYAPGVSPPSTGTDVGPIGAATAGDRAVAPVATPDLTVADGAEASGAQGILSDSAGITSSESVADATTAAPPPVPASLPTVAAQPVVTGGQGGATEQLGPPPSGTPEASPTNSPYANDKLTDISKVPDAQWISWPAYTPQPRHAPVPTLKGTGDFQWPTTGFISTPFKPEHQAIDLANDIGTPIVAADTGTVVFAGIDYGGLGYATEIDHGNGFVTTYGHQSQLLVKEGDVVVRGQIIGRMGSTGHSTGPHLHFVIKKDGKTQNPLLFLRHDLPAAPHPQVTVPDFTNLTPSKAAQLALQFHLAVKIVDPIPSTSVPAGGLFDQAPAANAPADVTTTIALHVSAGNASPTPSSSSTVVAGATSQAAPSGAGSTIPVAPNQGTAAPTPTATMSPAPTATAPAVNAVATLSALAATPHAVATPSGTATPHATPALSSTRSKP